MNEPLQTAVGHGDKLGPGWFLTEVEASDGASLQGTRRRPCIHFEAGREVNGKHDKKIQGENLSSHTRKVFSFGRKGGLTIRIKY